MRRMSDGVEAALHCALVLAGLPEGKVLPGVACLDEKL